MTLIHPKTLVYDVSLSIYQSHLCVITSSHVKGVPLQNSHLGLSVLLCSIGPPVYLLNEFSLKIYLKVYFKIYCIQFLKPVFPYKSNFSVRWFECHRDNDPEEVKHTFVLNFTSFV